MRSIWLRATNCHRQRQKIFCFTLFITPISSIGISLRADALGKPELTLSKDVLLLGLEDGGLVELAGVRTWNAVALRGSWEGSRQTLICASAAISVEHIA